LINFTIRCFDFPKILTMSRIIGVIIQKFSYRNITEERLTIVNLFSVMFRYEDLWIITLIILLIVYILGKSKHLIIFVHICRKLQLLIGFDIPYKDVLRCDIWQVSFFRDSHEKYYIFQFFYNASYWRFNLSFFL